MSARRKGKRARVRATRQVAAPPAPVHPLIVQAEIPAAQRARATYAVADIASPYGHEVVQGGVIRMSKAVRRVPAFETLYASKVFDRTVFVALEWYAAQLAAAQQGLFKCPLGAAGQGGGAAQRHVPVAISAAAARRNVEWARSFVPGYLLPALDAVMMDDLSFAQAGAVLWPGVPDRTAQRRVSAYFKLAANYLLLGIGGALGLHGRGSE